MAGQSVGKTIFFFHAQRTQRGEPVIDHFSKNAEIFFIKCQHSRAETYLKAFAIAALENCSGIIKP